MIAFLVHSDWNFVILPKIYVVRCWKQNEEGFPTSMFDECKEKVANLELQVVLWSKRQAFISLTEHGESKGSSRNQLWMMSGFHVWQARGFDSCTYLEDTHHIGAELREDGVQQIFDLLCPPLRKLGYSDSRRQIAWPLDWIEVKVHELGQSSDLLKIFVCNLWSVAV